MNVTREDLIPSLIENTTMQKVYLDGVHRQYSIKAVPGYVLHDSRLDWDDTDPETYEDVFKLGFTRQEKTFSASYDFETNPFGFYAVPESEVPSDQIFGGTHKPEHEIM